MKAGLYPLLIFCRSHLLSFAKTQKASSIHL